MASKMLLGVVRKLAIWELHVVLHMGATFKLNKIEFSVVILGVSDAVQSIHMMLVSMISHHTQQMHKRIVRGFKDIVFTMFSDITFALNYLMMDAEMAKRKALVSVFPKPKTLMCYFHVIKACEENCREKNLSLKQHLIAFALFLSVIWCWCEPWLLSFVPATMTQ
jgi:hypothetical protein